MDKFYATLRTLCDVPAPSGAEGAVRELLILALRDKVDHMKLDRMGNLICKKRGRKTPKAPILLAAHMDEVGLIVTDVTSEGYLKFASVGGIEAGILPAKRLRHVQSGLCAVVSAKPIHLYRDEDELYAPTKYENLYLDIGAKDRADAEAHVSIGDLFAFDRGYYDYLETDTHVRAIALDDRLGCAMLAELAETTPEYDLTLAFTVKEESGCRGAHTLAFSEPCGAVCVIEGTTASDLPEAKGSGAVCFQGKGGVLSLFDGATLYDRHLVARGFARLEQEHIPVQTKLRLAGGNDARAFQRAAESKQVLALSAPCRYIHSPVSTVQRQDLDAMRRAIPALVATLADALKGDTL